MKRMVTLLMSAMLCIVCMVSASADFILEPMGKRMWDRIEKTINMHGATAHVLRHTYATMAAGTGIDPKTLQSIMEHADIQTTMNRYAHRRMDKIEEAKETLKTMYL